VFCCRSRRGAQQQHLVIHPDKAHDAQVNEDGQVSFMVQRQD